MNPAANQAPPPGQQVQGMSFNGNGSTALALPIMSPPMGAMTPQQQQLLIHQHNMRLQQGMSQFPPQYTNTGLQQMQAFQQVCRPYCLCIALVLYERLSRTMTFDKSIEHDN